VPSHTLASNLVQNKCLHPSSTLVQNRLLMRDRFTVDLFWEQSVALSCIAPKDNTRAAFSVYVVPKLKRAHSCFIRSPLAFLVTGCVYVPNTTHKRAKILFPAQSAHTTRFSSKTSEMIASRVRRELSATSRCDFLLCSSEEVSPLIESWICMNCGSK